MSYQVLARKWRPQTFSELVGQQHVVDAISNALENDKLHHAYLFTGTRGVGKTTIARIFSKSLNCEEGQSANPCGKCDTCLDIADGRYVDLLEIDAASRTKVEDTRELLDNVQYRPTRGKYKVYLIDEVHMLSKHSFNALLKTLEEPPEHVKFLLATTDPQKLPVTILSRCLQFTLRALSKEQIQAHLEKILKAENIAFEEQAIALIAKAAQGSIRDSLSLTDQAIAQGNNQVTQALVANMLGLLDKNQVLKLVKYTCERENQLALEQLDMLCDESSDYAQILSQILGLLHQIALTQIVPEVCKLESDSAKGIHLLSQRLSAQHLQMLYQIALNGKRDLPYAPDARMGLQMTILRMLAFSPAQKIDLDIDALIPATRPQPSIVDVSSDEPFETVVSAVEQQSSIENTPKAMTDENLVTDNDVGVDSNTAFDTDTEIDSSTKPSTPQSNGKENTEQSVPLFDEFDNQASHNNQESYHSDELDEFTQANLEPQELDSVLESVEQDSLPELQNQEADNTLAVLQQSKQLDDLFADDPGGDSNGKKPELAQNTADTQAVQSEYALGHQFVQFDATQHGDQLAAILANGDKLQKAAQVDEWSAFVDSTNIQAFTRQLLLHANCKELSNPLKLTIEPNNEHLADESVLKSIKEKLSAIFGQTMDVEINIDDVKDTPFQIQMRINDIRLKHAYSIVETDNGIQELKKAFDASVIENSIVAR